MTIKIYLSFLLLVSYPVLLYSQSTIEERKNIERRKIKDFINSKVLISTKNSKVNFLLKEELNNFLGKKSELSKISFHADRKHYFMNGNKIATEIYNYGGIAPGYDLIRGVNNGVWKGSSYIFQFCPLIAAAVPHDWDPAKILHIVSDGLWDYPGLRELNPTGDTLWTFQPIPGYADPNQEFMASNPAPDKDGDGKPDSWPREWYNPNLGKYVWPGYLEQDATNADLEVFWGMDDRDNREFPYSPFPNDPVRRGLGVQIDGRALQWSNTLAENTIFFVYTITNISEKDLDTVFFGIYGDCDVGGGSPENTDDHGLFIPPYNYDGNHDVSNIPPYARSMVYFWDPDGKGNLQIPVGYVACKFLESPGNAENGIDDDGDGMIDERQDDGIDNDKDWNPVTDDVGLDGIPNTGDEGEGDGLPTPGKKLPSGALDPLYPGEPNFELTDLDESDQIGLTSFNSWAWNTDKVSNDESMWARLTPRNFGDIQQATDIVFIFGSGPISLKKGETKRISMALLFGENLDDLLTSAETVQRIYNANYRFFKPPSKPTVRAVPDDRKVTLYWDTKAEESIDPLTGKDFEGYVIYRSTDPSFNDIQKITDGRGSSFFSTPLKDINGVDARWDIDKRDEPFTDENGNGKYDAGEPFFDINLDGKWTPMIEDWWKGYHLVNYQGRGIQYYLGNNRGLVHSFVDSNNVINGQTYYYAVVAYDHGDSVGIPPSETTKKITVDPITSILDFDVNTVSVIPGPRASGYIPPEISSFNLNHESGIGNGQVALKLLNELETEENIDFELSFSDSLIKLNSKIPQKNYSVLKLKTITDKVEFFDTNYTKFSNQHLDKATGVTLKNETGQTFTEGSDYLVDYIRGLIRRTGNSKIEVNKQYTAQYRYFPVYQSLLLNNEDGNQTFDGVKLRVNDYKELTIDTVKSRWAEGKTNFTFKTNLASIGAKKAKHPADYEVKFSSQNIDTTKLLVGSQLISFPVKYSVRDITTSVPVRIPTFLKENPSTRDSAWSPGEEIIFFKPGSAATVNDTTTWGVIISAPTSKDVVPVLPTDGDVLLIVTERPFNSNDKFSFRSSAGKFSRELAKSRLDNIYVVPNPYVGYNELEPTNKLPGRTRGERRLYFDNLPPECKIKIFTLSGELVKTIQHYSAFDNGREFWNLLNEDGFSVAYGIYFAHIDSPGIGEKLLKFALIK